MPHAGLVIIKAEAQKSSPSEVSRQAFSTVAGGPFAGCFRSLFHVWLWERAKELKAASLGGCGRRTLPEVEAETIPLSPSSYLVPK